MSFSTFDIEHFIHELSDIPTSDCLVNIGESKVNYISFDSLPIAQINLLVEGAWKQILKQAQDFRQEKDMQSLCVASGVIHWGIKGLTVSTPLLLTPVDWQHKRLTNTVSIEPIVDACEVNPYVKFVLKELGLSLTDAFDELESVEEKLKHLSEVLLSFQPIWNIDQTHFIGNFHYHRFYLLRELEGIRNSNAPSSALATLFGTSPNVLNALSFSSNNLLQADTDQLRVFESLTQANTVVNGPPGTGKSQVLVNILGKSLAANLKTIVVSEKKVALEVLVKKLAEFNLDNYAFVFHSQVKAKDFINQLKKTWKRIDTLAYRPTAELFITKQHQDRIQLLLDRLNSPHFFGGVSYAEFQQLLAETPIDHAVFSSQIPDVSDWLQIKPALQLISERMNGFENIQGVKKAWFELPNPEHTLELLLQQYSSFQAMGLRFQTMNELNRMIHQAATCQLIENERFKPYSQLLAKPKLWNNFQQAVLQWKALQTQLEDAEREQSNWSKIPTTSQLTSWNAAKSWWQQKRRNRAIQQVLTDKTIQPEVALTAWNQLLKLKAEIHELNAYFLNLGLPATAVEIDLGLVYASRLKQENTSMVAELNKWPVDERKKLTDAAATLKAFQVQVEKLFNCSDTIDVAEFLQSKRESSSKALAFAPLLKDVPTRYLELMEHAKDWKALQQLILGSNLKKIEAVFPELIKYQPNQLANLLDELARVESAERLIFATNIEQQIRLNFLNFTELLRTESRKLSADDKLLKQQLKQGKSLLVKEFGKSKNHKSIRFLLDSDARHWIQLLLPIWMSTPVQVANFFPLTRELFDLVLLDEASQIALPNALGALYRSKRALVAGDSQQMSPSTFFGKQYTFNDLLDQAKYYYTNVDLHHHYRSQHIDLIRFSNENFYQNELIVYPTPHRQQVLYHHFCATGVYDQQRNANEAKELAALIESKLAHSKDTLGIVAFSEEQLNEIWKACNEQTKQGILDGIDNNEVFFKTLENVQGDEANCLIISMAYAKNPSGDFHLRFGPLNQTNGYKRLNVLFTRAKKQLHFFSSVHSSDFPISENEAVRLLQRFLVQLETNASTVEKAVELPANIIVAKEIDNQLSLKNIHSSFPNAVELFTFHTTMKQRGWQLTYV
jgi:hypothetical protein